MKNIYVTNKSKTHILVVDCDGETEFIKINEDLFSSKSSLYVVSDDYKERRYDFEEISYLELLNILTNKGPNK